MMTSSNGNILRVTGHLCGEFEFPIQRPVTRSFDVFFDLRLNKRLSKQWWGWWFETLSRPLWHHRNVKDLFHIIAYHNAYRTTKEICIHKHQQWQVLHLEIVLLTCWSNAQIYIYIYIYSVHVSVMCVNTLRPRQNGRHFADDIFKCIFLNENVWIRNFTEVCS